jgi:tetratricopeptide (TPR) repeat protein
MFGYGPDRDLTAAQAAAGFVRALGIPGEHIPTDAQDLERLLRSLLDVYAAQGRPVLVIIDNVSDQAQVLPLLPAHPACRAIVTSRHILAELNARLVDLDTLPAEQAVDLLAAALRLRISDDTRIRDHPDDARRVASLCGRLPLALQIVAALLTTVPAKPLAAIADELADAATRLQEMSYADRAVQAVFDTSYHQLRNPEARVFRLLSANPGPDISTAAAAALVNLDEARTRRLLEALARAHLIEPGSSYGRWRMHDLIRLHSAHHGRTTASADQRGQALARLLEHYLATAYAASAHLGSIYADPASTGFPSREQALAWLDIEYPNLTAATYTAAADPDHQAIARDLPDAMSSFMLWRRHFSDWITLSETALAAAQALHDQPGQAVALNTVENAPHEQLPDAAPLHRRVRATINTLGNALRAAGRHNEAIFLCFNIAGTFHDTDDHLNEGTALLNLGAAFRGAERFDEAITAYQTAARIFHDIDALGEEIAMISIQETKQAQDTTRLDSTELPPKA